jgi:hypothetical protein
MNGREKGGKKFTTGSKRKERKREKERRKEGRKEGRKDRGRSGSLWCLVMAGEVKSVEMELGGIQGQPHPTPLSP